MRILQAPGWYYPENLGGTEIYVSTLSQLLVAMGNDVVIAAPLAGISEPRTYSHDDLTVYRYPVPLKPTRDEAQGNVAARGSECFREWIAEVKPDVVHFHSIVTGLGLHEMRAAKKTGARVIMTSHASSLGYICQRGTLMRLGRFPCDGLTEIVKCTTCELQHRGLPPAFGQLIAREPIELSRFLGIMDNRVGTALGMPDLIARNRRSQRALFDIVDEFVVLTGSAAAIVLKNGAPSEKVSVNRLGIAELRLTSKPAPEVKPTTQPVRFGYLGRFDVVKGVVELAQALRSLPSSASFFFEFRGPVSSDADRSILERVKSICASDARINFAPAIAPGEVTGILSGYDVLVCPSVCAEGGPTVAIEAHAAGTPVVGTRIGGLAELVDDGVNGSLVPPGDVDALARMLMSIIDSPETIDRWRRRLPPPRTMSNVAEDYAGLYAGQTVAR